MAYAPCKNPNCKSYGKPHPNCKCYGELAEGGDVTYCNGLHGPNCEYFSDGGQVGTVGHLDAAHSVAGHIAHHGLLGMLKMDLDGDLEKYDKSVTRGHKTLDSHLDSIFDNAGISALEDRSKQHKAIDDWINEGGITHSIQQEVYAQHGHEQMLAKGGDVKKAPHRVLNNHPIEHAYPDQNIVLQSAKGRAASYLQSLKPQEHMPKLAFDDHVDQKEQKRKYHQARKIADHPLSVLHEVSKGSLDREDVDHLKAMYPEVHDAMQKKVTEKIIKAELEGGKKPGYKTRQSLSLLMGVPLSSELTPQGIQAAQAVFAPKQAQQGQAPEGANKVQHKTAPLSKSDSAFLTGGQALAKRSQKV